MIKTFLVSLIAVFICPEFTIIYYIGPISGCCCGCYCGCCGNCNSNCYSGYKNGAMVSKVAAAVLASRAIAVMAETVSLKVIDAVDVATANGVAV
jgi:hypothetical protein